MKVTGEPQKSFLLLQQPCLWPKHPHLCGAGLGEGGHHHLARGSGGGGNHGGQDGRHHPTSFQSVKLDQEEDEEKAHAKHLKRIKYIFPPQFKRKYMYENIETSKLLL